MSDFYPAKSPLWVRIPYRYYNALHLARKCRLILHPEALRVLREIPKDAGVILVSNHADEMDIRVFLEYGRRAKRMMRTMVNIEAFEEMRGFAGFWLTRIGCFSVQRGVGDKRALDFAVDIVRNGKQCLVMFPEGEIHYMNDELQPFKTGAARLGFEALTRRLASNTHGSVYLVPIAIKYRYLPDLGNALKKHLVRLEKKIQSSPGTGKIAERLTKLMENVVAKSRKTAKTENSETSGWAKLTEDIGQWRDDVLTRLENQYSEVWRKPSQKLMDRANALIAQVRVRLTNRQTPLERKERAELRRDLTELKRTLWLAGWAPQYHEENPSAERLAETVIKLEREILGKPRPKPLGRRTVTLRAGEAIDLSKHLASYNADSREACEAVTNAVRNEIQRMLA